MAEHVKNKTKEMLINIYNKVNEKNMEKEEHYALQQEASGVLPNVYGEVARKVRKLEA